MSGIVLGVAATCAYMGIVVGFIEISRSKFPIMAKLWGVGFVSSAGLGGLYSFYFAASWLPYELKPCAGMILCASNNAIEMLIQSRWTAAWAGVIGLAISIISAKMVMQHLKAQAEIEGIDNEI